MLDKKQIWVNFLFEFKTGHKAVETTHSINNSSNPGTANKPTMQWWFKKFCKRDKSFEDEESSGQSSEVDNDQLRGSLKLILLKLHGKLTMNSTSTILQVFIIWSKLERWKKLNKWVLYELTANQKKRLFWRVIFSYSMQQQQITSESDCDVWWKVDCIQQQVMTSSVFRPRRSSKALTKSKLAPKKGHSHWWSATVLIRSSFLNPG